MKAKPETIEKFNKAVIEALWNMPYEEAARWREHVGYTINSDGMRYSIRPITLSRVIQALKDKEKVLENYYYDIKEQEFYIK